MKRHGQVARYRSDRSPRRPLPYGVTDTYPDGYRSRATKATLTQRTQIVEEKTDRLETVFAAFMARTDAVDRAHRRVHRAPGAQGAGRRPRAQRNEQALGRVGKQDGDLVEDIVAPSIRPLAREVFDCGELEYFATRVSLKRSDDPSRVREFDALYVGADAVLLNQTKSTPRTEHVPEFVRFVDSGEFVVEHSAGHGELSDTERHLRDRDGRRSGETRPLPESPNATSRDAPATDYADARGSQPR